MTYEHCREKQNIFIFFLLALLGRDLEQILHQYTNFVKPAFEEFCLPVSNSKRSLLEQSKKI